MLDSTQCYTVVEALEHLEREYAERNPASREAIGVASEVLPGGETRSVLHFSPFPLVFHHGEGTELFDLDGHVYADFLNDYSAGLFGHTHPSLQQAIIDAVGRGLTMGGVGENESLLAHAIVDRFPAIEKVRFTNSGTEANLMAIAAARASTGRQKIMVMDHGYHGSAVYMTPATEKMNVPFDFVLGTFNDLDACNEAAVGAEHDLAAILVEPMMGASGCIPAKTEFLKGLQELAKRSGALLIVDEVMTSRFGAHGAHELYGLEPDLLTLGKYLGGGGSFGAFGGRADVMEMFDSFRPKGVTHGGTFNNNVITMAAGLVGLRDVYTSDVATQFFETGNTFRDEINSLIDRHGVEMQVTGMGSIMAFHHHTMPVENPGGAALGCPESRALLHLALLERGIYFARRGYISLSIMQGDREFDMFKRALDDVLTVYGPVFNSAAEASLVS